MNSWSWYMLHNFLILSNKQHQASVSPQHPYVLLSGPRPGSNNSQPRFTAWLHLGTYSPARYWPSSDCFVVHANWAPDRTQVEADLGLHQPRNPRACAPSEQLQTMSEHHHPAPVQLILHGGWRLVIHGHSQSLQLTGLCKSLPLIFQ